jgi:hypothetical protein
VLKNFPTEAELQQAVASVGGSGRWHEWAHYWAFEYETLPHA